MNIGFRALGSAFGKLAFVGLLTAATAAVGQTPQKCDVNGDGFINVTDINLITAARNQPATGPNDPRDADNNGIIDLLDARTCTRRCTLAACALPAANTAPVANGDTYAATEDTTLVVSAPGVLANDTDAQNNPLTAALVTGPATGTLVLSANGSFSYMPAPNFSGPVTFTYRANDGSLDSNTATVTINVAAVDDKPVAQPDTYTTTEDTPLTVAAPGVLANDTDVDNPALTASLVSGPPISAGLLSLNANGSFTFTPAANFTGAATFTYVASDGTLQSNVATVTVNVTPVNDAPVANADAYGTDEDVPLNVTAPGVLANDNDVEGSGLTAVLGTAPASGSLVLNPNGSFTYTPAPNFTGPATFTYRASDGVLFSSPATVTLTILPINDAPVAANDSYSTAAGTPLVTANPGVLGNDTDQEGAGLTASMVTAPASGSLSLNAGGGFTYTPNAGFAGTDTFTYRASDGALFSNVATVTIVVTAAANTPPVANDDTYTTPEDTTLAVVAPGVLGNDTDAQGNPLTATLVAAPAAGAFSLNANGGFSYTPPANFFGAVTFTYRASDGALNSNVATATINVTPVNDPPNASADSYTVNEDTPLSVAAPGVLANDGDVDGTPLTAVLVAGPAHGTLQLNANGSFSYTPSANYTGGDSFTYRASDGTLSSAVTTVSINVTPVNDAPFAQDDTYGTAANVPLDIAAPGVLANDSDVEGSPLTAVVVASPASGALVLAANGGFRYTPAAGFTGLVTFTYRANDGTANSNVATVTINVTAAPNTAPVANNDGYTTPEDTPLVVPAASGVLFNDTDADGNPLTAIQVTGPAQGNLALGATGGFTYTPPANFNGSVTFTYRANDGVADSNVATVTIAVTAVDDAPVASADTYSTPEDTPLTVPGPGVLGNDSDPENDPLTAALVSGPASGTLNLSANGGFTYTPGINFNGAVSFMYRANDGQVNSNVTTVTINVTPVNDAPVANADSYSTNEDTTLNVAAPGVLGNDVDVDNSGLTATLVSPPASGNLTLNPNGSFSYVPAANASGPVTFTYRASDGILQSTPATVTITVLPINDAPVAANDNYSATSGTPLVVAAPGVLANDADQEGSGLTATLGTGPTHGSLTLAPSGGFTYTPDAGYSGTDSFTYRAFDGIATSNLATVNIAVSGGTLTLTVQDTFIAVGGSTTGTITLSTPAPAGGTLVQLASSATNFATVAPASVTIPAGQTTGSFTVNGAALGSADISATAPGFAGGSVTVTVTASVITVGNVTVPPGGQAQFPVTLSAPAPAGGVTVALGSSNTGIATVPASVFIPAGQQVANPNPLVTGVAPGAATIRGTAPSYAPGNGIATVAIAVSISPSPVAVNEGQTVAVTLTLAQPAPAGGLTANLATAQPSVATVTPSVSIPASATSVQFNVTGVQQGTTGLIVSGTGIVTLNATINVAPPPQITLPASFAVGKDLQQQVSFTLGAPAPAGNLVVTINSSDPPNMLVSPSPTTAGSASFTMTVGAGQTSGTFYVQALGASGTPAAQVSAPGYANGQTVITLAPSGLQLFGASNFTTGIGEDTNLRVCAARLNGTTIATTQQIRGGATIPAALSSSNTAVGTVVGSPFSLTGGDVCTPISGGIAFHALSVGTSTLTVVQPPGFTTPSTAQSVVATVAAALAIPTPSPIGKDLQRAVTVTLPGPAPAGNLVVTLTSADVAKLLVSSGAAVPGAVSTTVTIPAGQSSGTFYAQALANAGTANVTATAPGYSAGTATVTFAPSGFRYANPTDFSTGVSDANSPLSICSVYLSAGNVFQNNLALRAGLTVDLVVTSSTTATGAIVGSPFAFSGGGATCQNTVQFDPIANGTTTLAIAQPAGFSTPTTGTSIVATVQANITGGSTTLGKDLQQNLGFSLGSPAPAGNLVVTITSADPARLLVAPNATTAGAASITIQIGAGSSSGSFYTQALASTGTVDFTVSAPGYSNGSGTVTLTPSGFFINSPSAINTTTLEPNTQVQVCVARLDPTTLSRVGNGTLRFGISPVSVSLTSSNTAVGTIVNSPIQFSGNVGCGAAGAFQFDPVGAGTATVALGPTPAGFSTPSNLQSIAANVTASGIALSATTVGKNLQVAASGSLDAPAPAGGVSVTLTSTDPARLLLAPNATTAGSASIVVSVAAGASSIPYTLQALDGSGTAQVTATAVGYGNGAATHTLTPSGFFINSPSAINTTTLDANSNVQVCVGRLDPTTLNRVANGTLRFGIAPVSVSMTSSNPAVGTIVNSPIQFAGNVGCGAGGAFQFDPVGAGTATVALTTPAGFATPSNLQSIAANVTASGITLNATTVGKNLQVAASGSLDAPAPAGGVSVTLTSADPARLLLAPNASTAGSASIVVAVAAGASSIPYTVQALDGSGTAQVTATAVGYGNGAATHTLTPSGFFINSPSVINTTTLDANSNVQVCAARLDPTTLNRAANGVLRFGIAPVSVSMTSSNPAVGTIVNSPIQFAGNVGCGAGGAFQFDPVGAGTTTVALTTPAGFSTPSNLQSIAANVTASGITLNATTVGKNLQVAASGSLDAPAPAGGVSVTLTSADPARLLLAPNASTAGSASIVVNVAAGASSIPYTVQALDGSGTAQVTATAVGYANGAATHTLHPSGFIINSPSAINATTLDANTNVQVCVARLDPTTLNRVANGVLRFGIAPVSVSMTSSNTSVGTIVNSPVQFAGNVNCGAGGAGIFQFDPVGAGATTVALTTPAGFSTPSNLQSIAATVAASGTGVGSGLRQR